MAQDRRKGPTPSYEEAPPTKWVPIQRADPVLPPAPRVEAPVLRPPTPPVHAPMGSEQSPFAVDRESQSGVIRRVRHEEGGRVVAIAVVSAAALLVLAIAFALMRQ